MAVLNLVDDMLKLAGKIGGKAPGRYPTRNAAQTNAARNKLAGYGLPGGSKERTAPFAYADPADGAAGFARPGSTQGADPIGARQMPYAGGAKAGPNGIGPSYRPPLGGADDVRGGAYTAFDQAPPSSGGGSRAGGRVGRAYGGTRSAAGRGAQSAGWTRPFPNIGMPSVSRGGIGTAGRRVVGGGAKSFLGPGGLILGGLAQGALQTYGDEQGALSRIGSGARGFVGGTDLTSLVPNQIMGHSTGKWGKGYSQFLPESGYEKTQKINELDQSIAANAAIAESKRTPDWGNQAVPINQYMSGGEKYIPGKQGRGFFMDENSSTGWSYSNGRGMVARHVDSPGQYTKVLQTDGGRQSYGIDPANNRWSDPSTDPTAWMSAARDDIYRAPLIDPYEPSAFTGNMYYPNPR